MNSGRSIVLVLAFLMTSVAATGQAAATSVDGATQHIQTLGDQAFQTLRQSGMSLQQREDAFGEILREGFDLKLIARFVIGKYWRQANDDQRQEYLDVFSVYVIKTYARRLGGFEGQSFKITGTKLAGEKKDVMVNTSIDQGSSGPPIVATWRVRDIDGQYKIIDVVIEGVSMAVTQRQEFASVTRRSGIEGLVQVLRAQTERMSATAG